MESTGVVAGIFYLETSLLCLDLAASVNVIFFEKEEANDFGVWQLLNLC